MSEPAARQSPMINLDEFERRLGRPTAPLKSNDDPLIELARLVGGTEDRFKSIFQNRPAATERAPAEPHWDPHQNDDWQAPPARATDPHRHPLGGDFAAVEAGLRASIDPEFEVNPTPEAYAEAEDENCLDAPYAPPNEALAPVAEAPRSRLPLYATAAIIIAGIAGIGATFVLKRSPSGPHEIAMIEAAAGPIKVQASTAADSAKPMQDASILDKSPQPTPAAAVDHSEQPVDLTAKSEAQASPAQVASTAPGAAAVVPVPPPPASDTTPGQSFGLAGMIEPKMVKTVTVRPDGTVVSGDALGQPALPTIAPPAAPAPAPAPDDATATMAPPPAPKATDRVETASAVPNSPAPDANAAPASPDDTGAGPSPIATEPKPAPAQAEPAKVAEASADATAETTPVAKAGSFAVQLAAPASEAEARQSMAHLQRAYGAELAGHRLKYHLASVANKTVYRVRVVGLSHEEATALCQRLQAKGGNCFVARN
jgi:hypothetical protein